MSKVIKYPYKIECPYCECSIAYSKKDINSEINAYGNIIKMVKCPNCGGDIFIRKVLKNGR